MPKLSAKVRILRVVAPWIRSWMCPRQAIAAPVVAVAAVVVVAAAVAVAAVVVAIVVLVVTVVVEGTVVQAVEVLEA